MKRDPATAQRLALSKLLQKESQTTPHEPRWVNAFLVPLASRRSGGGASWVLIWSVSRPGGGLKSAIFRDVVGLWGGMGVFIYLNGN